ncbi:MAG: Ig domain-containing protein, partial [Mycoplasma sp.]|nr:Ig domain-containing protein [Mycoplasma sp.]
MKQTKLLKSILIPTLGVSAIGTIPVVSTSCGSENPNVVHVAGVTLDKTSMTLAVGDTETLSANVFPETATDKSVTWSSNNESVAIVNENGTITAIGVGNATITVTTNDGGLTATCEVTVDTIHVTGVTLDKTSTTLAVGDTKTLTATILPENATDKSVTWSSNNESVAIVNENGTITAIGVGNATITVTTNDGGL